jgi:hypothetical protein
MLTSREAEDVCPIVENRGLRGRRTDIEAGNRKWRPVTRSHHSVTTTRQAALGATMHPDDERELLPPGGDYGSTF